MEKRFPYSKGRLLHFVEKRFPYSKGRLLHFRGISLLRIRRLLHFRGKAVLTLLERRTGVEPAKTGLGSRRNTVIRPPRESRFNRDVSVITKSGGFVNFLPPQAPRRVFQTVCTPPQRRKKRRRAASADEIRPRCKPRRQSLGNSGIFRRK